jgi:MFS family permease
LPPSLSGVTRNRWTRILGVALVLYVLSYIDRSNIALAFPAMRAELGMTATAIGFATGVFFWGYMVLQVPAGRMASVWSAKRTILLLAIGWALVAASTALVHSETGLVINRFVLGIVEGGNLPATLVLIRNWFTRQERARANMVLLGFSLASVIGNPVAGLAVATLGWRAMFLVTAAPALLWCIVWFLAIDDHPRDADWLDRTEKERLVAALEAERQEAPAASGRWIGAVWHPVVILLSIYNLFGLTATWGLLYWLPTLLVEAGKSIGMAGLLSAIPFAASIVLALLFTWTSDLTQERKWHTLVPTFLAGFAMLASTLFERGHLAGVLTCLTFAAGLWYARLPTYWILVADALPPEQAGVGMAVANGFGNLGGFFGPFVFGWLRNITDSFDAAMIFGGVALIVASVIALPLRPVEKAGRATLTHKPEAA